LVMKVRQQFLSQFWSKTFGRKWKEYPVSFNGKMRFTMVLPLDLTAAQIEEIVMKDEEQSNN
jgi:leucyl-tRNA synthetase